MNQRQAILFFICFTFAETADAHLVSTRFGEFYSGLLHPLTSLLHVVPWIALGLFAALHGKRISRWNIVMFTLSVAVGVVVGWVTNKTSGQNLIFIEWTNIFSFVAIGLSLLVAIRVPKFFYTASILFGVSHGVANGLVNLSGFPFFLYLFGVLTTAWLVMLLVSAGVCFLRERYAWSNLASRVIGSWILASGIIYTGFSLGIAQ